MNATLEKYLDTVDKCLKPLPTSERVDIVKEIKGSILEMEGDNLTTEQILDRLGILNLGLPYMENMGVFTGLVELNPIAEFVVALVIGVLLFLAGRGCWKLLVNYCKKVSKTKSDLSI